MRVVDELKNILTIQSVTNHITEHFIKTLNNLTVPEVNKVVTLLSERFPDVARFTVEEDLPRVGEEIHANVFVRKVEQRTNKSEDPYWLVSVVSENKNMTKTVYPADDKYKVAWKVGPKWEYMIVEKVQLRAELAKLDK